MGSPSCEETVTGTTTRGACALKVGSWARAPRQQARKTVQRSAKGADARHHERRNTPQLFRWPLDTATVLRVFLKSAKGADARHQERRNTPQLFRWPLDTATVLRVFLKSAKGADARHQERRNTPQLFRWPLDTATVLRVFLKSAKGADARRQGGKKHASPFGGRLIPRPSCACFSKSSLETGTPWHSVRLP